MSDQQAYSAASALLEKLIDKQVLVLPSTRATMNPDGKKDAEYIKDFVTGLADFYKSMPGY